MREKMREKKHTQAAQEKKNTPRRPIHGPGKHSEREGGEMQDKRFTSFLSMARS